MTPCYLFVVYVTIVNSSKYPLPQLSFLFPACRRPIRDSLNALLKRRFITSMSFIFSTNLGANKS